MSTCSESHSLPADLCNSFRHRIRHTTYEALCRAKSENHFGVWEAPTHELPD